MNESFLEPPPLRINIWYAWLVVNWYASMLYEQPGWTV